MADVPVFDPIEKAMVLSGLDSLRSSMIRLRDKQVDGSSMANAVNNDIAALDKLVTKVGKL